MDRPEFHRLAEHELNEAAQYYELENPGLGAAFLQETFVVAFSDDFRTPSYTRSSRRASEFSQ